MAVNKLWEGVQVVDKDGNQAYVTREDAKTLAKHYGLGRKPIRWENVLIATVPALLVIYAIVALFIS